MPVYDQPFFDLRNWFLTHSNLMLVGIAETENGTNGTWVPFPHILETASPLNAGLDGRLFDLPFDGQQVFN